MTRPFCLTITTGALSQITSDKYLGSGNDADEHTITFNPPITNDSGNVWMYAVREVNSGTFKINNIDVSVSGNSNWMYVDCGTNSVSSLTFGARASNRVTFREFNSSPWVTPGSEGLRENTTPKPAVTVLSTGITDGTNNNQNGR